MNGKLLRLNPIARWELRVGELRVFYDVASGEGNVVRILAVGRKAGSVLRIGARRHACKDVKLSAALRSLVEYARELGDDILVLPDRSKPVAATVPLKGVHRESLALSAHPEFLELIARSCAEFAVGRKLSLPEMKRAVLQWRSPERRLEGTRRARRSTLNGP